MLKVILDTPKNTILESNINENTPIFAFDKSTLKHVGMIVKESSGWTLKTGGQFSYSGYCLERKDCMKDASEYDFYIEKND